MFCVQTIIAGIRFRCMEQRRPASGSIVIFLGLRRPRIAAEFVVVFSGWIFVFAWIIVDAFGANDFGVHWVLVLSLTVDVLPLAP